LDGLHSRGGYVVYKKVGDHKFHISTSSPWIRDSFGSNFGSELVKLSHPDFQITVEEGYGTPFINYNVEITERTGKMYFQRADYLIEADKDYKKAKILVQNELALKHAMMNLYSSYIVYHNWGLMIHSSSVIEGGKVHIFAGQSGAGKSTAARLSQPRELLSDEASLVKIENGKISVYDSPFRSELPSLGATDPSPLSSIQFLQQALQNKRVKLGKADALMNLMDKVFFWAHSLEETKKVIGLVKTLINQVPVYELHFKKDDTFWELIS
jgi:hypothetical protein